MTPRKKSTAAAKKEFDRELESQAEYDPNESQFDDYKTDLALESEGIWVDDIQPGLQCKIRHVGSEVAGKWLRKRSKKQKSSIAATQGYLDWKMDDTNKNDLLSQVILIGWRGPNAPSQLIDKSEGADLEGPKEWIPCTPSNSLKELREHRPMRDALFLACNSNQLFGVTPPETLREIEKN